MRPKSDPEIDKMRIGGKLLAAILDNLAKMVEPGVTSLDISKEAARQIKKAGLKAVLLGYQGFPDVICISINDQVVHGIPTNYKFKNGDIVKLDLTVGYKGMIVDSALSVIAGTNSSADVNRLMQVSERSLYKGIDAIQGEGTRVGDIASTIEKVLNQHKLGIVRDLVGHGVGYSVHEDPNVPNYGIAGTGPALLEGTTIAIEPMATLGDWRVNTLKDGWTIVTRDGSLAAHFEHTVLITKTGAEILTQI